MATTAKTDLTDDIAKARQQLQELEQTKAHQEQQAAEALRQRQEQYHETLGPQIEALRTERSQALDRLTRLSQAKTLDLASLAIAYDALLAVDAKCDRLGRHEASVRTELHGIQTNTIGAQTGPLPKLTANYDRTTFTGWLDTVMTTRRQAVETTAETELTSAWWEL
jgi:hypothetical protein